MKTKKYQMKGGGTISADCPKKVIEKLRKISFNPGGDLEEFMEQTAKACRLFSKAEIRTGSNSDFVNDLIENGFLEAVNG